MPMKTSWETKLFLSIINCSHIITVSLAGADIVEASDPVELESESNSARVKGKVSFIHLRYSITSSVTRIIRPSILYLKIKTINFYPINKIFFFATIYLINRLIKDISLPNFTSVVYKNI